MARNDPQVNLRIPQKLKTTLESAAVANNRSLTAEVVARLEQSFAHDERSSAKPFEIDPAELSEIEKRAEEWNCSRTQAFLRMTLEGIIEKEQPSK